MDATKNNPISRHAIRPGPAIFTISIEDRKAPRNILTMGPPHFVLALALIGVFASPKTDMPL
jgi:hypothetical protein